MKNTNLYLCSACQYQEAKWFGCCPRCQEWETAQTITNTPTINHKNKVQSATLYTLKSSIIQTPQNRLITGIDEWDRVMGGGIMPGSLMIITGDPGIGKSTLLLHIAHTLAQKHMVIYFCTEESNEQVMLRAQRINAHSDTLFISDEAQFNTIVATINEHKPELVIIDSIQNCFFDTSTTSTASLSALKESTYQLMRLAKQTNTAILLTGHITKDGTMAGPKVLEHLVDAVFYLQGEDEWQTRVLRAVKNRFGPIHELGFFAMDHHGLHAIPDINAQVATNTTQQPGSVLISTIQGTRPLLLELQALTIPSKYAMPQRVTLGIDQTQIVLIAAILEKYLPVKLSTHDIFFKVSGSVKIKEGAADLGIALALLSSYFKKPLPTKTLALAEITLTGSIKPIHTFNLYSKNSAHYGIKTLYIAQDQVVQNLETIQLHRFGKVYELLEIFNRE
jgi:DNA repair protein RadA/Sms